MGSVTDRIRMPSAAPAVFGHDPLTKRTKGQTSMVLIVLVILLFAAMVIFLIGFAKNIDQSDYLNFYTHNLLLSVMRADTGYSSQDCRLVSDAIACSFFKSGQTCGNDGLTCFEVANKTITEYIGRFALIKKSYRYLLTVEPQGFTAQSGLAKMSVGDANLSSEKGTKFAANEQIRRALYSSVFNLNAKIIIMQKD